MRLSTRVEYGMRAVLDLALHYREGPIPLREIANREGLSFQYLEQIFPALRKNGLVDSIRGPRGGYILSRPPEEIRVGDVFRAIEGPVLPVDCLVEDEGYTCTCGRTDRCLARNVWERLRDKINEVIDGMTLQDLIDYANSGREVRQG